uniref:Uncharacterized protein n=1 Tax=Arundo donax TaxID=35708 RepID=A0A0A9HL28_ARUDO
MNGPHDTLQDEYIFIRGHSNDETVNAIICSPVQFPRQTELAHVDIHTLASLKPGCQVICSVETCLAAQPGSNASVVLATVSGKC